MSIKTKAYCCLVFATMVCLFVFSCSSRNHKVSSKKIYATKADQAESVCGFYTQYQNFKKISKSNPWDYNIDTYLDLRKDSTFVYEQFMNIGGADDVNGSNAAYYIQGKFHSYRDKIIFIIDRPGTPYPGDISPVFFNKNYEMATNLIARVKSDYYYGVDLLLFKDTLTVYFKGDNLRVGDLVKHGKLKVL